MFNIKGVVVPWDSPGKFDLLHSKSLRDPSVIGRTAILGGDRRASVFLTADPEELAQPDLVGAAVVAAVLGAYESQGAPEPVIQDIRPVQVDDSPAAPREQPGVVFYEG